MSTPVTPNPPTSSAPGSLPQSTALAEASPSSLAELMDRDPESYQAQDLDRIIEALRADRARREEASAKAAEGGRAKPKAVRIDQMASAKAEDLGL